MRSGIVALILAVLSGPLTAQQTPATRSAGRPADSATNQAREPAVPQPTVEAPDTARAVLQPAALDSLRRIIDTFRRDPLAPTLPSNDDIAMGGLTVPAGTQVTGPVASAGGPLHVYGTVNGDAIAVASDVIVHTGGRVTGNAVVALGTVTLDGGTVDGEMRRLAGALGPVPRPAVIAESPVSATRHAVALSFSWLVILVLIGIGVLLFATDYLDGVTESLEGRFGRSFWAGIAAQLALAPVLALLVVALAVTILGILLIPFAIVAFVLAVVGLITLGFLAVARLTGESIAPGASRRYTGQRAALRGIVIGVVLYMGLWVLASAFAWAPMVEAVLRVIAVAITWVAATAGLGAAVLSRGGTRRPGGSFAPAAAVINDVPWQTPTPVTGVVAARRPTPSSSPRDR
jgi:hypothetical protein